jgi:hypothetical protein
MFECNSFPRWDRSKLSKDEESELAKVFTRYTVTNVIGTETEPWS